jgi:hypothetical protein
MKRVAILLAALLVMPLVAGPASAAEKGIRRYLAETSDGQVLRFRTVREDTGRRLDSLFFGEDVSSGVELSCDDGTTRLSGTTGFSEWPWYFEGQTVTVAEYERNSMALHFAGTFRRDSAEGTFRYNEVFINRDVTSAVLCTTSDLTWTAERVN